MKGLGTIANVLAVVVGGTIGMFLKSGLKPRFHEILMQALGLCSLFIGISGAVAGMLKSGENGTFDTKGSAVLIASLVIGALIGEFIDIDKRFTSLGEWLKKKAGSNDDAKFVQGFVTASLVICIGAMAIVGSIEDGINGNASMLYAKAVLDGVIVLVFASAYGKGVIFSAIPVGVIQGVITIFAAFIAPFMTEAVIQNLSFVGSVLVFCVGANLCLGQKFRVANMLPALVICAFVR